MFISYVIYQIKTILVYKHPEPQPLSITNPISSNNTHKKRNQIANDGLYLYAVIPNQRVCFPCESRVLHVAVSTTAILKYAQISGDP